MTVRDVMTAAGRARLDDIEMLEGSEGIEMEADMGMMDDIMEDIENTVDAGWFE